MDAAKVQTILRERLGLRVGPAMAGYMLSRIRSGQDSPTPPSEIPVIATDARTGAPVRRLVNLCDFDLQPPSTAAAGLAARR